MPTAQSEDSGHLVPPAENDVTGREVKFEAALAELEQIVAAMEEGRLPLEESLAAYRRGSELLQQCQRQLTEAERQVQILESGVLRDFAASSEVTK